MAGAASGFKASPYSRRVELPTEDPMSRGQPGGMDSLREWLVGGGSQEKK